MNKNNKLSPKTRFVLFALLGPVVLAVLMIGWARPDSRLSIARKLKYTIVIGGAYISALTYSYAAWKKSDQ